ncbi:hypothetical protein CN969_00115 [Bacillus thuringiensis]|nr:hypothetical protein CN969_00115 [Bacillus thuringiensis]
MMVKQMDSIKINQIYVSNFKLFNKEITQSELENCNLVILDGPNGFGKTSMFDVIELVLTGRIDRVKANSKNRFKEVLWLNDPSKDCVIKVEFILTDTSENKTKLSVGKRIPAYGSSNKNLPNDFSIFETYLSDSFETVMHPQNEVTEQQLFDVFKSQFNNIDVFSLFRLIYYVEQENNRSFLKNLENERYNILSNIFDTILVDEEKEELLELEKMLKINLEGTNESLQSIKAQLKGELIENDVISRDKVEYIKLFSEEKVIKKEWDKKDIIIKHMETRDKYVADLNQLKYLVRNFNDFKNKKDNNIIMRYIDDNKTLRDFILSNHFLDEWDNIKDCYEKQISLWDIYKNIKNLETFKVNWEEIDYLKLYMYTEQLLNDDIDNAYEDRIRLVQEEIGMLSLLKKNSSSLGETVRELNDLRNNLIREYSSKIEEHKELDKDKCPLCGYEWTSQQKLLEGVKNKTEFLKTLYDDTSLTISNKLTLFYQSYISDIVEILNEYFKADNKKLLKTKNINILKKSVLNLEKVNAFKEFCLEKINLEEYCIVTLEELTNVHSVEQLERNLIEKLKGSIKSVPNEVQEKFNELNHLFKNHYDSQEVLIKSLTEKDIEQKIQYLNYKYYHYNQVEKERLIRLQKQAEEEIIEIEDVLRYVKDILKVYNTGIKQYYKKIIDELQIVFYIYSGRILQSHQRGLGVFMIQGSTGKNKEIRFITRQNEHDISNYMSSGQLSAVILALTLSINKIYGNEGLDILLIDDPLQTLDDLNIASFVELLRNEFYDKQIFLSTHEDDSARYITYKFGKFGLSATSLNMKDINYIADQDMNTEEF